MGSLSPLVAVLLAALGTLLMIGVVALALVQVRRRRPRKGFYHLFRPFWHDMGIFQLFLETANDKCPGD